MRKKNIEQVFQEKLQDFSQLPEGHVWDRISQSLDEKRDKRRILPLWWRIAGVAALLAAGLFIFLPEAELPFSKEIITDTDPGNPEVLIPQASTPEKKEAGEGTIAVTDEESANELDNITNSSGKIPENPESESGKKQKGGIAVAGYDGKKATGGKVNSEGTVFQDKDVVETGGDKAPTTGIAGIPLPLEDGPEGKSQVVGKPAGELAAREEKNRVEELVSPEKTREKGKISILEAIAAQDEELTEKETANRWEVGPRVAPVFFSSLAQGSPIHSSFRDNAKSGNVNMSYGVSVSYELGKKVKIRSGVHKVDFGYDTRDVSFSSSVNASTSGLINNIDYSLSSRNLVVRSNTSSGKMATENAQDVAAPDPSLNGKMIQEFGYLEVPMELTYEILDRKLGVNLVGGVSSLFLLNNTVLLEANGNMTEMGEANNLNDLNFSTNIGLGFSYRVNDKIQLSLEPMFKYQLNTFSDSSGDFQPFSMGVYSGLNFRF